MMRSRKQELIRKIHNSMPNPISIPYMSADNSPNSTFNSFRQSIELCIKEYVDRQIILAVEEFYTTEDFEEDLGLNKPK